MSISRSRVASSQTNSNPVSVSLRSRVILSPVRQQVVNAPYPLALNGFYNLYSRSCVHAAAAALRSAGVADLHVNDVLWPTPDSIKLIIDADAISP
jgi:hypothetical protein